MKRLCCVALFLLCACAQSGPLDLDALAGRARGGDAAACRKLIDLLGNGENRVNDRVYPLVVELGAAAVPYLLERVEDQDRIRREHVIAALGSLGTREAVTPIGRVLRQTGLERRYVAAWALGEIGDAAAIPVLIAALDDEDAEVRKYATRSLIKLDRAALVPLSDFLRSATPRGAAGAIRALGDIGDPSVVPVLLSQSGGANRPEVFLALGKLKDPRAEAALIAGLGDRDWRVRMNAALALGPVGSSAAVPALRKGLDDEVMVVREWSARSLGVITGKQVNYRNERGEQVAPYSVYH